jgi:hypothetical protein
MYKISKHVHTCAYLGMRKVRGRKRAMEESGRRDVEKGRNKGAWGGMEWDRRG